MKALLIQSDNPQALQLLADAAARMGGHATPIDADLLEDLALGELMNHEKTGEQADKQGVLSMLNL